MPPHPYAVPPVAYATQAPWGNWGGNQTCTPAFTVRPTSEREVLDVVRFAHRQRLPVRAVGGGYSATPVVNTGGILLRTDGLTGITGIDPERRRVRLRGGTRLKDIGDRLWEAGLALSNQGDLVEQTIAGAVATATHGSGVEQTTLSERLRWVRIVTGLGEVVEIGEEDVDRLRAVQVCLGALGVMTELELEVSPRYHLREELTYPRWEEARATLAADLTAYRHLSFMWCQRDDSPPLYELPCPAGLPMAGRLFRKTLQEVPGPGSPRTEPGAGVRVDRSYRIYDADGMTSPFHELEYFVPAAEGLEALERLQNLIRTSHPDERYPVEVRWVKGDLAHLSPSHGRDSMVLSVSGAPGQDYWPYLRDVDALLEDYDARPHWGKIHFLTRERVEAKYPEHAAFLAVRRELDPDGLFLNDSLRQLVG